MASILEQCYIRFITEFPESWLPNGSEDDSVFFNKSTQINEFLVTCFVLLSKSIISGEYIKNPEFQDVLNNFLRQTAVEYVPPRPSIPENELVNKIFSQYIDLNISIYNALKLYSHFVMVSRNKFNTEGSHTQYAFYKIKKDQIANSIFRLFSEITIPLCLFDYRPPVGKDEFHKLLMWRDKLEGYITEERLEVGTIIAILLYKCNFIIYNIKESPFYITTESSTICINPKDLELNCYGDFILKGCDSESEAKLLLNDINGMRPQFKSFVLLMKYYKQSLTDKSDLCKMDYVLKRFSDIYQIKRGLKEYIYPANLIEEYNKFSLDSILNFLHNCRFSFYTQNCEPNLKQIKGELRHIENIQAKTGVRNFHPYEKAIEAIIKCIERHLEEEYFDNRLIEDKIDELNRVILLYKEAYEWSCSHQFFPFQLPFEESVHNTGHESVTLFVPSAYAKYINYNRLKERLEQINRMKEYLRFRCDLLMERKEITQIKNDIKISDKKAYDLIAIFTAAITFLFGAVNIFINNSSLNLSQLIVNTIGFGILLLLFTSLYLFISPLLVQRIEWGKYIRTGRCIVGIALIAIYAILAFTLSNISQTLVNKVDNIQVIDSLHNKQKIEIPKIKAVK